ncbi:immunoglobulin domain-containing protein, partial [Parabacteroides sp. 52]|uniref:immunoglobulin domain-containing protein n=1 Tax=Parabacteroides sp. 52 TaxID=2302940 RepID=UPI001943EBB0
MKQVDLSKQKKRRSRGDSSGWRLWCIMLCALFLSHISGYAQQLYWSGNGLTTPTATFPVAGKAGFLDIKFATSGLSNGKVKVTLPANFKFDGLTTGGSYTPVTDQSINDQEVVLTLGALATDANVLLQLKILALKGAETGTNKKVIAQVQEGDTKVGDDASLELSAVIPQLKIAPEQKSIDYGSETETHTYTVELSALKADVHEFDLRLTTNKELTLSNLKIGSTVLTDGMYTLDKTTSTSLNYYQIPVTETLMGRVLAKDGAIQLSVDAKALLPKTSTITVEAAYPDFTTKYFTAISQTLTLKFQAKGGTPVMKYVDKSARYTKEAKTDAADLATSDIPLDLSTYYAEISYTNEGKADAYRVNLNISSGGFSFIDKENIYFKIDGDATPTKLSSENITKIVGTMIERWPNALSTYADEYGQILGILPLERAIPVGKKITFWVGMKAGQIYDNKDLDRYSNFFKAYAFGANLSISSCESASGGEGVPASSANVFSAPGLPYWREVPAGHTFDGAGDVLEQKIWMGANQILDGASFDVKIDLPEWLELDADYTGWGWTNLYEDPTTLTAPTNSDFATTGVLKFASLNSYNGVIMHFKFKVKSGYSINQKDKVFYRITYYGPGSTGKLENVYQVAQPVFLSVQHEAVQLNTFKTVRTTRGYVDSDNNGVPDTGAKYDETDNIQHTIFTEGDKGKFVWEGTINNAQSGGALFMANLLYAHTLDMLSFDTPQISWNGGTSYTDIDLVQDANRKDFLVKYSGSWSAGANYRIELPFTVLSGSDAVSMVESKAYVHTDASVVPTFADAKGCAGIDQRSSHFRLVPLDFEIRQNDTYSITFNNNIAVNQGLGTVKTFFNDKFVAPHYKDEARVIRYPETFIWNLPAGYALAEDTIHIRFRTIGRQPTAIRVGTQVKGTYTQNEDGSRQYTFELGKFFDLEQKDNVNSGQPAVGKVFSFPDDQWEILVTGGLYASKNALANAKGTRYFVLKNLDGLTEDSKKETITYRYGGGTIDLSSEKEIKISGKNVTTQITVSNPNDFNTDVWVYVDGPAGLTLTRKGAGTPATSLGNGWFKLGNLAKSENANYDLSFTGEGTKREDFKVTVYTLSNYETTWGGPSGSDIFVNIDDSYKGRSNIITVKPQMPSLEGSLAIESANSPAELVNFQEPYKLIATISSANSKGSSIGTVMAIRVPAGQQFIADDVTRKAEVSCGGNAYDITQALKDALSASNNARTVQFVLSDYVTDGLMLGSEGITTENLTKQQATLTAWFTPECGTTFDRYTATLQATNVYGQNLTGSVSNSKQMTATTNINYSFEGAFTGSKQSFTDGDDARTLTFTVTKKGPNVVDASSFVQLVIPSVLDVDASNIKVNSSDLSLTNAPVTVLAGGNTVDPATGLRTVQLSLPTTAYTGVGSNNGQDAVVTYSVPVVYTAPAQSTNPTSDYQSLLADPVKNLTVSAMGYATFGNCGSPTATPIGSFDSEVAFVITNGTQTDPVKAFVGEESVMEVLSSGFAGTYTIGSGSAQATGAYTPSSANYTDDTPGIDNGVDETVTIQVKYGAKEFGSVTTSFKVYPSLAFDLDQTLDRSFCGDENVTLNDYVDASNMSRHTNVTFYSDLACQTPVASNTLTLINQDVTYYAKASNNGGDGGKQPKALAFTRKSPITFDTDVPTTPVVLSQGQFWSITVAASGASNLSYQWYKNGTIIPGETSATYSNTAATSDAGDYYVVVSSNGSMDNICNHISGTVNVSVLATPANVALKSNVTSPLTYCDTELSGKFLWNMIEPDSDPTITYYYNTDNSSTYTSEVSDGNKVQLAAGTYYLKAKNTAGGFSAAATSLQVVVNTSVSAALAFNGESVTTKSVVLGSTVTFTATGAGSNHYALYRNGSLKISHQASGTFTIPSVAAGDAGSYTVMITTPGGSLTGFCGKQESDALTLNVLDVPDKVELPSTHDAGKTCGTTKDVTLYDLITNKA